MTKPKLNIGPFMLLTLLLSANLVYAQVNEFVISPPESHFIQEIRAARDPSTGNVLVVYSLLSGDFATFSIHSVFLKRDGSGKFKVTQKKVIAKPDFNVGDMSLIWSSASKQFLACWSIDSKFSGNTVRIIQGRLFSKSGKTKGSSFSVFNPAPDRYLNNGLYAYPTPQNGAYYLMVYGFKKQSGTADDHGLFFVLLNKKGRAIGNSTQIHSYDDSKYLNSTQVVHSLIRAQDGYFYVGFKDVLIDNNSDHISVVKIVKFNTNGPVSKTLQYGFGFDILHSIRLVEFSNKLLGVTWSINGGGQEVANQNFRTKMKSAKKTYQPSKSSFVSGSDWARDTKGTVFQVVNSNDKKFYLFRYSSKGKIKKTDDSNVSSLELRGDVALLHLGNNKLLVITAVRENFTKEGIFGIIVDAP